MIETEKGDLIFHKIEKVAEVKEFIVEKMGAANMNLGEVVKKKEEVELTA